MLTIGSAEGAELVLIIPNNNVRRQYCEYMLDDYQTDANMDMVRLTAAIRDMAFHGNWRPADGSRQIQGVDERAQLEQLHLVILQIRDHELLRLKEI